MSTQAELEKEFGARVVDLVGGRRGLRGGLPCDVRAVSGEAPVLDFIGSDETLDRYNEVINQDGWDLANFRKNPVIPDCHDYSSISKILGRAQSVSVEDGKLMNRVEFCTENPMGNLAYKMAKGGFINSQSVGFIPLEWEPGVGKDQPDRTYVKQELLEISLVVVPANPGATVGLALKSGAINKGDIDALRDFLNTCATLPKRRLVRFKAGQKVKLDPEHPGITEFPFCEIGTKDAGEVVATYTRAHLMDVEFETENFAGMIRGGFELFVPVKAEAEAEAEADGKRLSDLLALGKDFCGDKAGRGTHAGASGATSHEAQLLQLVKTAEWVLQKA